MLEGALGEGLATSRKGEVVHHHPSLGPPDCATHVAGDASQLLRDGLNHDLDLLPFGGRSARNGAKERCPDRVRGKQTRAGSAGEHGFWREVGAAGSLAISAWAVVRHVVARRELPSQSGALPALARNTR